MKVKDILKIIKDLDLETEIVVETYAYGEYSYNSIEGVTIEKLDKLSYSDNYYEYVDIIENRYVEEGLIVTRENVVIVDL